MKIRRGPLIFHNVLYARTTCGLDEWEIHAHQLRRVIVENDLYATGPIMYQVVPHEEQTGEFHFYQPVNRKIQLSDQDTFGFIEEWRLEDGLLLRHADMEEPLEETHAILLACAEQTELQLLQPFLHIYLEVYGEGIVDVFAPIKHIVRETADDQSP